MYNVFEHPWYWNQSSENFIEAGRLDIHDDRKIHPWSVLTIFRGFSILEHGQSQLVFSKTGNHFQELRKSKN